MFQGSRSPAALLLAEPFWPLLDSFGFPLFTTTIDGLLVVTRPVKSITGTSTIGATFSNCNVKDWFTWTPSLCVNVNVNKNLPLKSTNVAGSEEDPA